VKGALELQQTQLDPSTKAPMASSSITLTATAPLVSPEGNPLAQLDPAWSLAFFQRLSPANSVAASIERSASSGTHMTAGGTRQIGPGTRLRGKWGTTGVLALALEVAGDRSSITFVSEVRTVGALSPRFGATVNLAP